MSKYKSLLKKGFDNLSYQNNELPFFNLSYLSQPKTAKLMVAIPQINNIRWVFI